MALYIQYKTAGLSPHFFPNVVRHCQNILNAFLVLSSMCSLHSNLLSRMTPRYLTLSVSLRWVPKSIGICSANNFRFLVKRMRPVLSGVTDSPDSLHHSSTMRNAMLITELKTSSKAPEI